MSKRSVAGGGLLLMISLVAGTAQADSLFGLYLGAGKWEQSFSGEVASGPIEVDVETDLDLGDDRNNLFYAAFEHGVPLLPNVRVHYLDVTSSGTETLSRSIEFNGEVFSFSEVVASEVEFTQKDAVLYYQLLDNVLSLDLGIGARWLDGHAEIASSTDVGRVDFDEVGPMLYGRARVDLPFTGLWVGAELMGVAYDGDDLLDANAQIGWESPIGLGAEVGWRGMRMNLDDIGALDV